MLALCLTDDDDVDRNHCVVAVTPRSTEPVVTVAANRVQPSVRSSHIFGHCPLTTQCPAICYWLENNVVNLPGADDVMRLCGGSCPQQQRSPLTILFGSAVTSTVATSTDWRPAGAVSAAPWRPFSVHEDRPISAAPSLSTTAASHCTNGSSTPAESPVDQVDRSVSQHHTALRTAVGRQYTATNYLPGIPFVPVLPDGLYSRLAVDQFHHQRLLSSVRQQVSDGGSVYPAVVAGSGVLTARQQCVQCGVVFSTLDELIRHQQSSCNGSPKSSSSAGSNGSPPTRSPSPLLSCPHCDKSYTSSGALKMHVRTHTLPCRCPLCDKSFSRPWLLQGHLRTHTGERPFSCAICGRAFADRSNLRAHCQTHSAAKRYQCTACRRSFSRLSLLVRHERHTATGCCRGRHSNDDATRNKQ